MKTSPHAIGTSAETAAYEKTDSSLLAMAAIALSMVLLIVITLGVSALYLKSPYNGNRQTSFTDGAAWKSSVQRDQEAMRADTAQRLQTYAWLDRATGIVQIPIKRAMELEAKEAETIPGGSTPTPGGQ